MEIPVFGRLTIIHREPGKLATRTVKNLVVTAGREWVAARLLDASIPAQMSHMAIGLGTAAPTAGDTALGSEGARVALTSVTRSGDQLSFVATFPPGTGLGDITEAGIFNAASAGAMLNRATFPVKSKSTSGYLDIIWDVRIGAAPA